MGWSHVYVTAHGGYDAGHFAGETAQIGFRWTIFQSGPGTTGGLTRPMPKYPSHSDAFDDVDTAEFTGSTFWTATAAAGGQDVDKDMQTDLASDMLSFLTAVSAHEANQFKWTHIKCALIADSDGAGKYLYPSSVFTMKTPVVGKGVPQDTGNTILGAPLPPDVAVCVSYRAPVVGRKGRGRMYVPALNSGALAIDGTLNGTVAAALATAGSTLFTDLANVPGIGQDTPTLVVTSAGAQTGTIPMECRVGNHFDTQRSRDWQAQESYTIEALTTA